jgi:hypothetical protein
MAWLTGLRSMPILKRRVTTVPEQALHDAVTELRAAILALTELIQREYPNREEVEKRFTKKKTSQRRWFLVLALIPIMLVVSLFGSAATVSYCFLSEGGYEHPGACGVIPGYNEAVDANDVLIKQFEQLIATTETNKKRINNLERQMGR